MSYVQIALVPVPVERRAEYLEHAHRMSAIFREHGAVVADDHWGIDLPPGKRTDFLKAVDAEPGETVVVGMMTWQSKDAADTAMAAMRKDPRMADIPMPFDGGRIVFGGFEAIPLTA